jgi:diacylglycerol kinase family enzyme
MRVLILHSAGAHGRLSKSELVGTFERAGHQVRYRSTHRPHWKKLLAQVDVVVAAGGDGTVATAAIALAKRGRKRPPLAVIPAGKANNIARALGAPSSPAQLARALDGASSIPLGVGLIRSPWGVARFVESAGIGPLASLFRIDLPTLRAALRFLRNVFDDARPRTLQIRADRRDLSGEYLLVHVMNIDAAGPRLVYAKDADPGDDWLDLVLVPESQRRAFARYLDSLVRGIRARYPIDPIRARRVEIAPWPARGDGHIDDKIWPDEHRPKQGRVRIQVETTIPVLVPRA